MKTLLFGYGTLQEEYDPPKTERRETKDKVKGLMFDLGDYPVLIAVGYPLAPWISGEILEIDDSELSSIDKRESDYQRVRTLTQQGEHVWIYVYKNKIPVGSKLISKWRGK